MIDEPNWRRLEVGRIYKYEDDDDIHYFTILANHGNDNYRVLAHDEGKEYEYNLTGLHQFVFDV